MENEVRSTEQAGYTVVARRYRPKSFEELIGQDHIAQALGKAISSGRVGHAYLFTGARGVGKTSTARIFAKALNTQGVSDDLRTSDIAEAIDSGDDMDVIEIDGASNRGIEEIRQLRANVNVRPSRSVFKIYIIDEVHMLTNQAFNALLKTLEEPPAHVKFIFCTTDPDKIPITVLSRCQRFDFVPVKFEAIQRRLKEICECEGFSADDEALGLLARRAAGSMRDSQSLLEQVMSFSVDRITVEQVHTLLGTADEGRLLALVEALRDAKAIDAISLVDESTRGGADAGQLAEQLLNYLRDIMAVGIGGGPELLKLANPSSHSNLQAIAKTWGVQTVLSAIQILDESLVRMRSSVSSVTLLEVAVVQVCQLEQLSSIPELLQRVLQHSGGGSPVHRPIEEKKKTEISDAEVHHSVSSAGFPAQASSPVSTARASQVVAAETSMSSTLAADPCGSRESETRASEASIREASGKLTQGIALPGNLAQGDVAANPCGTQEETAMSVDTGLAAAGGRAPSGNRQAMAEPSGRPSGVPDSELPASVGIPAASADSLAIWKKSAQRIDGMLADFASLAVAVEPLGSEHWKIVFPPGASRPLDYCDHTERRAVLQEALAKVLGRSIRLSFAVMPGEAPRTVAAVPQSSLRAQKMREMAEHPYVKKLCEVLDGEIIRIDSPREETAPKSLGSAEARV